MTALVNLSLYLNISFMDEEVKRFIIYIDIFHPYLNIIEKR